MHAHTQRPPFPSKGLTTSFRFTLKTLLFLCFCFFHLPLSTSSEPTHSFPKEAFPAKHGYLPISPTSTSSMNKKTQKKKNSKKQASHLRSAKIVPYCACIYAKQPCIVEETVECRKRMNLLMFIQDTKNWIPLHISTR